MIIIGEMCVLSLIYSYVAVCRLCVVCYLCAGTASVHARPAH